MTPAPWLELPPPRPQTPATAVVIGAGLAGSSTARALAERNWQVKVFEQGADTASGASGNRAALLRPHASRDASTAHQFFAHAYEQSLAQLQKLSLVNSTGLQIPFVRQTAAVQLSNNPEKYRESEQLRVVTKGVARKLCGVDVASGGLFFPTASTVDIAAACRALLDHPGIERQYNFKVSSLTRHDRCWHISDGNRTRVATTLVLANGASLGEFPITRELAITAVRGQTTLVDAGNLAVPKIPVCGKHYLIPQQPLRDSLHGPTRAGSSQNLWQIGASFDRSSDQPLIVETDNTKNLQGVSKLLGDQYLNQAAFNTLQIIDNWASVRATTPDRLPVAGALPDFEFFQAHYADLLRHGRAAACYPPARYLQDIYVIGGFGSRGLCVATLCANMLATQITAQADKQPGARKNQVHKCYLQLLHPARFQIRKLKKSG